MGVKKIKWWSRSFKEICWAKEIDWHMYSVLKQMNKLKISKQNQKLKNYPPWWNSHSHSERRETDQRSQRKRHEGQEWPVVSHLRSAEWNARNGNNFNDKTELFSESEWDHNLMEMFTEFQKTSVRILSPSEWSV